MQINASLCTCMHYCIIISLSEGGSCLHPYCDSLHRNGSHLLICFPLGDSCESTDTTSTGESTDILTASVPATTDDSDLASKGQTSSIQKASS